MQSIVRRRKLNLPNSGPRALLLALAIVIWGALPAAAGGQTAAFVTLLGDDTLAVERVERTADGMRATVVLRAPRVSLREYEYTAGAPARMVVWSYDAARGMSAGPVETDTVVLDQGTGVPFIDMVHWPYELLLERAAAAAEDSLTLEFHTSRRPLPFVFRRLAPGEYTATHPTRGTMTVTADAQGRLLSLDAAKTTRALKVERRPDIDVDASAAAFAAHEAARGPMGDLSGRGETIATVAGAEIVVDYGRPLKRGREIFGALVPYGRVWRTGANRATHFSTNRDLVFGETIVPAGTYTLFSVPRADGFTLLVNKRTEINGQAYDETQDLARLEMQLRTLPEVVEPFTILVDPAEDGGVLRLQWDRTEAYLPFRVRN